MKKHDKSRIYKWVKSGILLSGIYEFRVLVSFSSFQSEKMPFLASKNVQYLYINIPNFEKSKFGMFHVSNKSRTI